MFPNCSDLFIRVVQNSIPNNVCNQLPSLCYVSSMDETNNCPHPAKGKEPYFETFRTELVVFSDAKKILWIIASFDVKFSGNT